MLALDTTALVEYGPTTAYGGSLTDGSGSFGRFRRFELSGLTAGVAYYIRVTVTDRAGNRTVGTDYLLQATGAHQWDYDAVGNRLLSRNPEGVGVSYTHDEMNRLTFSGSTSFAYGANGNLVSKVGAESFIYEYYEDRLTRVTREGLVIAEYAYDADGRRIMAWSNGETNEGCRKLYSVFILAMVK